MAALDRPYLEGGQVLWPFKPCGVEVKTIGRSVRAVVPLEVACQHTVHILAGQVGWARVYHGASVALQSGAESRKRVTLYTLTQIRLYRRVASIPTVSPPR